MQQNMQYPTHNASTQMAHDVKNGQDRPSQDFEKRTQCSVSKQFGEKSDILVPFKNQLPKAGVVNSFLMPTSDTGFGHFSGEYPKDDPDAPLCPPAPTLKRLVIDTRSAVE